MPRRIVLNHEPQRTIREPSTVKLKGELLLFEFGEAAFAIAPREILWSPMAETDRVPSNRHHEVHRAALRPRHDREPLKCLRGPSERGAGTLVAPDTEAPRPLAGFWTVVVGSAVSGGADDVRNAEEAIEAEP